MCGPGGCRSGGGAGIQQVPAAGGVTSSKAEGGRADKKRRLRLEAIWLDMRVCRQSHGRVVGLRPAGRGLKGWRKGGSVGSKRSNSKGAHARNAARPESSGKRPPSGSISVEPASASLSCPRRPRASELPHDFSSSLHQARRAPPATRPYVTLRAPLAPLPPESAVPDSVACYYRLHDSPLRLCPFPHYLETTARRTVRSHEPCCMSSGYATLYR